MDIDRLGTEERKDLMSKGLCFYCKEGKHLARECPKKKGKSIQQNRGNNSQDNGQKKRYGGRDAFAHIRAILHNMEEEEVEIFYATAKENKGF